MGISATVELIEYTDPGCSWAWGTEPKLRLLRRRYGDRLRWRRVMGGLVEDMAKRVDGWDAERAAPRTIGYWADVTGYTGMPYPARLRYVGRSTVPACRAVKAAERQSERVAQRVLRRLREQTFVFGQPADSVDRILTAATGVEGLDVEALARDLDSEATEAAYRADWEETRRPNRHVLDLTDDYVGNGRAKEAEGHMRYAFPTVVVRGPAAGEQTAPGWQPYARYEEILETVSPGITEDPRPDPSPDDVFVRWGTAAPNELAQLCGPDAEPPPDVVPYDWGAGVFYLWASEANARGLS